MTDSRAKALIERQGRLASERTQLEATWQDVARVMAPERANFQQATVTPGELRDQENYDDTAARAANNFSSGLWGAMCSPSIEWFEFRHPDQAVNEMQEAKLWLDDATARQRNAYAAGGLRFYTGAKEVLDEVTLFGTAVMYTAERVGKGQIFFSQRPLAECYIAENDYEEVDTLIRRFRISARQAMQRWGDRCSRAIRMAADRAPEQMFVFLHAAIPSADYDWRGASRFPVVGVYVDVEAGEVMAEDGFHEFPYQVPRWSRAAPGPYGVGLGMRALASTRMLNEMKRTTLAMAHRELDPPKLAPNEDWVRGMVTTPGGTIYGGVNEEGQRLIYPYESGGNFPLTLEMMQDERLQIDEGFFRPLMTLIEQRDMTVPEVLERVADRQRLLGPHVGRIQSEFLDPVIDRTFAIMYRAGAFLPPPDVLLQAPGLRVEYVSPMARSMKSSEAEAIMRSVQAGLMMQEADQSVMLNYDLDEAARGISEALGAPAKLMRGPDVVAQAREQAQQASAAAQMAQAAQPVAGAIKDVAQAAQIAQQPPAAAA